MTSEQAMLWVLCLTCLVGGCIRSKSPAPALISPYDQRQVWAVMPLRNESGSLQADGLIIADHLARQLENASNIDVLPVNRSLAAMQAMQMQQIVGASQARMLLRTLEADALLVGTLTDYDPYDPPKLGLAVELYHGAQRRWNHSVDTNQISRASTGPATIPPEAKPAEDNSVVSAFFDAADPRVREAMQSYANGRGPVEHRGAWHRYRISMDLFIEFASYVVSKRLLREEAQQIQDLATVPAQ